LTLKAIYVLCVDKSVICVKSDWRYGGFVCRKKVLMRILIDPKRYFSL